MVDRASRHRLLFEAQTRTARGLRRLAGGSIDGRAEQAAPLPERPRAAVYKAEQSVEIAVFTSEGAIAVTSLSWAYEVLYGGRSLYVIANLRNATGGAVTLTGTTTIAVKVNGVSAGNVSISSGQSRGIADLSQATNPASTGAGDIITLDSTAVGTGTAYATVQVHVKR